MQGKLILMLGGSRSGKSGAAEQLAKKMGEKIVYIASAAALDEEMLRRVKKHRAVRPKHWRTVEETHEIAQVLRDSERAADVFLFDCLTLWISNLLLDESLMGGKSDDEKEAYVIDKVDELARVALSVPAHLLVVSSEVGQGIVPEYPISRLYRDIVGLANQTLAGYADEVYLTVAGIPVELKSLAAKF